MNTIPISDKFKKLIKSLIRKDEFLRVDKVMDFLSDEGHIEKEFSKFFNPEKGEYDPEMELIIYDEVEDEVKRQLLERLNETGEW